MAVGVSAAIVTALAVCVAKNRGDGAPVVPAIAISPDPATVAINGTQQFQVAPPAEVTWGITEMTGVSLPAFPLKASANGRYLVDRDGRPFFIVGDAAQSAAGALTQAQFQSYVDTRVSQGFNTVNINLIEHYYAPSPPADRSGNLPFGTTNDFSTANDAYLAGVVQKIAYAQSKGVFVFLAYYVGGGDHHEGWYDALTTNSLAKCQAFGSYLANGHGAFGGLKQMNVAWVWGADWLFSTDTAQRDCLHAIAQGLKNAGSTALMSGDWGGGNATQQTGFQTFMDLQNTYTGFPASTAEAASKARSGYSYDPSSASGDGRALTALPQFLKETGYEAENFTASDVRTFHWAGLLNGDTTGVIYGHRDVWGFAYAVPAYSPCLYPGCTDYTSSLGAPGAQDMSRLAMLIRSIAWHELVPSGTEAPFVGRTLIGDGNDASEGGSIAAAQSPDGTLLVAYSPMTISFKVDLRGMAVPIRARWWNPTSGLYSAPGTSFDGATTYAPDDQVYYNGACYRSLRASNVGHVPDASPGDWQAIGAPTNTGFLHVTTPGDNGSGASDWVLIIDPSSARCGNISASGLFTAPSSVPEGVSCQVTATLQGDPSVVARAQLNLR
jgi:hypothetical protein